MLQSSVCVCDQNLYALFMLLDLWDISTDMKDQWSFFFYILLFPINTNVHYFYYLSPVLCYFLWRWLLFSPRTASEHWNLDQTTQLVFHLCLLGKGFGLCAPLIFHPILQRKSSNRFGIKRIVLKVPIFMRTSLWTLLKGGEYLCGCLLPFGNSTELKILFAFTWALKEKH